MLHWSSAVESPGRGWPENWPTLVWRFISSNSTPSLGGVTAQLGYMFPHHNCLLCRGTADHGFGCTRPSISPDFLDFNRPANLHILTLGDIEEITGEAGSFTATARVRPRYVEPSLCINCDRCSQICPAEVTDQYSLSPSGAGRHKAAYKPDWRAIPNAYVIDKGDYCRTAANARRYALPAPSTWSKSERATTELEVAPSSWLPATVARSDHQRRAGLWSRAQRHHRLRVRAHGSARPDPVTAAIRRPSDGAAPKRIAWLQCVGSRDKTHDYCSAFCCMYATKQAALVREALPEAQCEIFFMDDRVFGKQFLDTYESMRQAYSLRYTRCRLFDCPGRRQGDGRGPLPPPGRRAGSAGKPKFDLMVLSIGAEPAAEARPRWPQTLGVEPDAHGFVQHGRDTAGRDRTARGLRRGLHGRPQGHLRRHRRGQRPSPAR